MARKLARSANWQGSRSRRGTLSVVEVTPGTIKRQQGCTQQEEKNASSQLHGQTLLDSTATTLNLAETLKQFEWNMQPRVAYKNHHLGGYLFD